MKKVLITGGAGFVGSHLALRIKKEFPSSEVIALDNLKRRGSELSLSRLKQNGVEFIHGDVRNREDLFIIKNIDLIIDCSAEPSALAGRDGAPDYVLNTNLVGTLNCLELARREQSKVLFLSTSRVYPVKTLNEIKIKESETRFEIDPHQTIPGFSTYGVSESFSLEGARTIYGTSKLSSELIAAEYYDSFGIPVLINRCGVLTGPWQMGKVDQGVTVLWVARHIFGGNLSYIGYGGTGKQVRDLLHVEDLFQLLLKQLQSSISWEAQVYNVGGGTEVSVSLRELTALCEKACGNRIQIQSSKEDRPGDIPLFITDYRKVSAHYDWKPLKSASNIVEEIAAWIKANEVALKPILS